MLINFKQVREEAKKFGRLTVSIAVAQDREVLEAIREAGREGLVNSILVGDESLIKPLSDELGLASFSRIEHEADADKAALTAANLVRKGDAQILMKGAINSSNFLRAALNPDFGLRSGKLLSHFVGYEIPGEKKLVFSTDGGINVAPTLEEKKQIVINSVEAFHKMGIAKPYIAALAANEQVNPKIPATMDARALEEMQKKGELPLCILEGPMAMDVAVSMKAARHKGIESKIAGNVDLFLVPNIEAGNILGKTIVHYTNAKVAGVILGATNPMVMISRNDNSEAKLNSVAIACLMAGTINKNQ